MKPRISRVYYLLLGSFVSVILHNAVYGIWGVEDAFFFIVTFLLLFLAVADIIYATVSFLKTGKPKDVWKLSFLGFIGLLGVIPGVGTGLFGFFGFFGYFSARK